MIFGEGDGGGRSRLIYCGAKKIARDKIDGRTKVVDAKFPLSKSKGKEDKRKEIAVIKIR